ncbi:hypothetical protein CYV26_14195 [Carnobacterium maltaromaticum]|uniref:SMODS-associated NUDIX domain-containing protein n=1 Tax=Carnobacterium maltaromaticum TaxID=2751 RepID=UPI000C76CA62|nr:hypothetical protein [Carnobacterium maltaromaticum]PLS32701.1 hypothetical protein CYV33_14170 [Carnobacterium maltaromaticum]PLS33201.1 hypothetical protein CYV31_13960 [Carnobacterium maltaromaticum]PLS33287.1 hypothetical protein CYV30_13975 [Carnobacterium maltaromaticum]PLS41007.1 hypothetical protein CYV28_13920 [Carnobacterium maltaromaticum]PLS41767.1 hypothetical protein CYV27_13625 [Carnobacterium maltaromaticum]
MNYIISELVSNVVSFGIGAILTFIIANRNKIKIRYKAWRLGDKKVRMSLSYLFQIKSDGKFLLILGNRIQQYQPIGGVYKYYDTFDSIKQELEVSDESNQHFFEESDLRIELPGKNVIKMLEWFKTRKNRESTVLREFIEEIIDPGLLDMEDLRDIRFEYINTKETSLRYSPHFKMNEYLTYDMFKVKMSDRVMDKLKKNVEKNDKYLWVSQNDIDTKNTYLNGQAVQIGEHAKYITIC